MLTTIDQSPFSLSSIDVLKKSGMKGLLNIFLKTIFWQIPNSALGVAITHNMHF